MSIEKDINQRNFKSEFQKALVNMVYTYNWVTEKMKTILDKEELTPQQFNILRILRGSDKPLSTLQIRQRMLDKMSDTSRIVDRLVLKGLAQKVVCSKDKRLVDVTISEKGLQLLHNLDQYEAEMEGILQSISIEEAKTLNSLLDKIRQSD